jgi:hypothetical protein
MQILAGIEHVAAGNHEVKLERRIEGIEPYRRWFPPLGCCPPGWATRVTAAAVVAEVRKSRREKSIGNSP